MAWALINTNPENKYICTWDTVQVMSSNVVVPVYEDQWRQGCEIVELPAGSIMNIIYYDGISPYTPKSGRLLVEVPDSAKIGDPGYLP